MQSRACRKKKEWREMVKHSSQREGQRCRLGEGQWLILTYRRLSPISQFIPLFIQRFLHLSIHLPTHPPLHTCIHSHAGMYPSAHACMHPYTHAGMHSPMHACMQSSCHPSVHLTSHHFVPHPFSFCLSTHLPIIHLFSIILLWTWVSVSPIHPSLSTVT